MKDANKVLCRLTDNTVGQVAVKGDVEQWAEQHTNKNITVVRKDGVSIDGTMLHVVAYFTSSHS